MSRFVRNEMTRETISDQGKVTDKIKHLMTYTLVFKTQFVVHELISGKHQCVIERPAKSQII